MWHQFCVITKILILLLDIGTTQVAKEIYFPSLFALILCIAEKVIYLK